MTSGEKELMTEPTKPQHYKDLLIWQKGMALAKLVYQVTQKFPSEERYGLTSQLRRASRSRPTRPMGSHREPSRRSMGLNRRVSRPVLAVRWDAPAGRVTGLGWSGCRQARPAPLRWAW